ncbi:MAG TPA: hypothetical protein PK358_04180 [Spirochaetota bacterium]|nr:hypothetical protein [Spirochaetota bacterium]HPJ34007.1 hypothetical protein [Spirochaetota bacterium]
MKRPLSLKRKLAACLLITLTIPLLFCGEKKDDFRERLNYYNSRYRFRITFPENWINYSAFEMDEIIDPDLKVTAIYFALPTRSRDWQPVRLPSGYASIFSIRIFSRKEWDVFTGKYSDDKKEINSADRKIGENSSHVFMIKNATSIPVDLYFFMKEVPHVAGTFRVRADD